MELPENVRDMKVADKLTIWQKRQRRAKAITKAYVKLRKVKSIEEAQKIFLKRLEELKEKELRRIEREREEKAGIKKTRRGRPKKKKPIESGNSDGIVYDLVVL